MVPQNCHLATSWLTDLERIVENIDPGKTAKDFRLWLTTASAPEFPVPVLQCAVKLTNDPPVSLKQNLKNVYHQFDDQLMHSTPHSDAFRSLLFGTCVLMPLLLCTIATVLVTCRPGAVPRRCARAPALRSSGLEHPVRVQR